MENRGMGFRTVIEFSEVFDEQALTIESYLNGISRSTMLSLAIFFLGFNHKQSKYNNYRNLLADFFGPENSAFANQVKDVLEEYERRNKVYPFIINVESSLRLFEYCFDKLTEEETQSRAEAEINIFKAYLLFNQEVIVRDQKVSESIAHIDSDMKFIALCIAQTYPYSDIVNFSITEILTSQVIKSTFLFEFLEKFNSSTQKLLEEFCIYYKCTDWQDFLNRFLPLAFMVINAEREGHIEITIPNDSAFQANCDFLEKLAVDDEAQLKDYDYRKLRSQPFYKVSEGVYKIIFGLFVIEKIFKGLYFKLNEINNTIPEGQKVKQLRSFYCGTFSEEHLLYNILEIIYKGRYIKFSGKSIKSFNYQGEPDYYIRNKNKVILFESKDILINAEIKPSGDFVQYETAFKQKFYYHTDPDTGKISKKAVLQLIHNIKRVLLKEFRFDQNYISRSVSIYPVLLLHDHQFNIPGLNVLINTWFDEELIKLKEAGLNTENVRPIVIIDIDTLINYQDAFADRKHNLAAIIDDYFAYINTIKWKKVYRDVDELKQYQTSSMNPFSIFLSHYFSQRKIKPYPKMFETRANTIFKKIL